MKRHPSSKVHQVMFGFTIRASLRRAARRAVDLAPAHLRHRIPIPIKRLFWKFLSGSEAVRLEMGLWSGFSEDALAGLRRILADEDGPADERGLASLALARWYAFNDDFGLALAMLAAWSDADPRAASDPRHIFLSTLYLMRNGQQRKATDLLASEHAEALREQASGSLFDASLALVAQEDDGNAQTRALNALNALFRTRGLSPITKKDPNLPLSLDNLRGTSIEHHFDPDNPVTVIVPVYNGADFVVTALQSLADQSWSNLEVIVVDDASTDATAEIVAGFCTSDTRFRLLAMRENGGSYAARNEALKQARGRFVTVHDADDWAHPDRIAIQVRHIVAGRSTHTLSLWARCTTGLQFIGPWRPTSTLLSVNMGSHLFRREVVDAIGGWDTARVSADSEFIRRIAHHVGGGPPAPHPTDCPLVLGRVEQSSLTQTKATHLATFYHGIRREYLESATLWHSMRKRAVADGPPYFPAPRSIRSRRTATVHKNFIVADWNDETGWAPNWALLEKLVEQGGDVAVFQYPNYQTLQPRSLEPHIRRKLWERGVTLVAAGETVRAERGILAQPSLFAHRLDRFPTIRCDRLFVLCEGADVLQLGELERAHIEGMFEREPEPISLTRFN